MKCGSSSSSSLLASQTLIKSVQHRNVTEKVAILSNHKVVFGVCRTQVSHWGRRCPLSRLSRDCLSHPSHRSRVYSATLYTHFTGGQECGRPEVPAGALVSLEEEKAEYRCRPGYSGGGGGAECRDGYWEGKLPTCTEVECPDPVSPKETLRTCL